MSTSLYSSLRGRLDLNGSLFKRFPRRWPDGFGFDIYPCSFADTESQGWAHLGMLFGLVRAKDVAGHMSLGLQILHSKEVYRKMVMASIEAIRWYESSVVQLYSEMQQSQTQLDVQQVHCNQ